MEQSPDSRIALRPARSVDSAKIDDLLLRSYSALLPPYYDAAVMAAALPLMVRSNPKLIASGRFLVAVLGDTVVGCGGWSTDTPGSGIVIPGVGHVRHFATDPAHLRKGIASAILSRCMNEAHAAGLTTLDCFSTRAAEAFYAASGFVAIAQRNVMLADRVAFPAIEMRCAL